MDVFKIKRAESDKYPQIEEIFEAQGLEINETGVNVIKGYLVEVLDRIVGGSELILQDGEYTFSVAVNNDFKGQGIGLSLFKMMEKDIRNLGAKRILIQAKAPTYWSKLGFVQVGDPNDVPRSFRCDGCPQYGKDCFPKIMVLAL